MWQTRRFSLFIRHLGGLCLWMNCGSVGKSYLVGNRFSHRVRDLSIGFHPILYRLHRCFSISAGIGSDSDFAFSDLIGEVQHLRVYAVVGLHLFSDLVHSVEH